MPIYVTYLRVSTARQGNSGLGLEAQREAVSRFIAARSGASIAEFIEIESGRKSDRPRLREAVELARERNATLLIAKLDRLARNVAFIANLLEAGVEIAAADLPEANRFLVHILAAVAEWEAKAISDRTKAALAAAKTRGAKLGWANASRSDHARAIQASVNARSRATDERANALGPRIFELRESGQTLRQIADTFTRERVETTRGGSRWHPGSVVRLLGRWHGLQRAGPT